MLILPSRLATVDPFAKVVPGKLDTASLHGWRPFRDIEMKRSFEDALTAINAQRRVEDLWNLQLEMMSQYGFDRQVYGSTRQRSGASFGDPQDFVLLSNLPADYMEAYVGGDLFKSAPMVKWSLENVGAASWKQISQTSDGLTEAQQQVVEFNHAHNVTAGYTISFPPVNHRTHSALALIASEGQSQDDVDLLWASHGQRIEILCNSFQLKLLTLPYDQTRSLTSRQREVLEWVGDGKTTQDIAVIMGLTAATVEKHMRLAREAMDVDTTAQAVLKAAFYNQIFVIPG